MNYRKPEIALSSSALVAIQGTVSGKPQDILQDFNSGHEGQYNETVGAYESDE